MSENRITTWSGTNELIDELDRKAAQEDIKRSQLVRRAVREYLKRNPVKEPIEE